ncbi:hypothetical protein BDK51DRAFT_17704 [Blyttiomyces helicus]|uniref:3-oxoacyl-reductase n=1 Tax=Blyttiomyces helicus TaxID=388810 RepID=A0A4P9VZ50_9FUNG|nr:hypothetical protein BDK51DRAFT_17704 [Blyttiomyces helicus]|eukprot:RKO84053.1 hypothetical protein BDK51DRAFT_17704 [Blyttiomyces helicus]
MRVTFLISHPLPFQQLSSLGPIDVLVNSAGITGDSLLITMDPQRAADVITTNLLGTIYTCRAAARGMLRRKQGCIINIASVAGIKGNEGQSVYSASKAGVIGFTRSLARELGGRNIRVNAIVPGYIETEMTAGIHEDKKAAYRSATPLGRFGTPEDIAQAAVFLSEAKFITGQSLVVDGGLTA